ncbi:hypothetical protein TNCV_3197661 [Trichonephila clavipes]|nr:hypothetical protein TNCV_3197661 [Trichonephila clavipes]
MPSFKITLQIGNPSFTCVLRAELATICFVSFDVANTIAVVHYCKLLQKNFATIAWLDSLREKKGVVSYEDLLTINGTKYLSFHIPARAAGLSKSEDFLINEVVCRCIFSDGKRQKRILRKK